MQYYRQNCSKILHSSKYFTVYDETTRCTLCTLYVVNVECEIFRYAILWTKLNLSKKNQTFSQLTLLTVVIPNFRPFRSISYRFLDNIFGQPKFCKMLAHRPICFGYMTKTNQIAGEAYRTSLDSKIEDMKPGSACPTKNSKI